MPLKDTEEPANGVKRDLLVVSKKTYQQCQKRPNATQGHWEAVKPANGVKRDLLVVSKETYQQCQKRPNASQGHWEASKWYFVSVERGKIADKLQPKSINVSFTTNFNVAIDVSIFTFDSDQLVIDVETGTL